jgi:hypothetical protein
MSNDIGRRVASGVLTKAARGMGEEKRYLRVEGLRPCCHPAPFERERKECPGNQAGTHHPNPKPKED